jgi:hypothetical protein
MKHNTLYNILKWDAVGSILKQTKGINNKNTHICQCPADILTTLTIIS